MATSAGLKAHRAGRMMRHAAANPWLELLERVGYFARGILYAVMGGLALRLALGIGGKATHPAGSLATLAQGPIGRPFLIIAIAGLAAYSLWGFVRAMFEPWRRGSDATGLARRLGFMWSGFAYASIVLFALHMLAGNGPGTPHDSTQAAVMTILSFPADGWPP